MVTLLNYLTTLSNVSQLWHIKGERTSIPRILSNGYAACGFQGVEVHIYLGMAKIEKRYPTDTFSFWFTSPKPEVNKTFL